MNRTELNKIWKEIISQTVVSDEKKLSLVWASDEAKIEKIDDDNNFLVIITKNEFTKILLETEFFDAIVESSNTILNSDFKFVFLTEEEWKEKDKKKNKNKENTEEFLLNISSKEKHTLNPNYRFDNFIVSQNNKMLIQAALAITSNLGGNVKWNPFFIYGGSGLGKTHILHSIGNKARDSFTNFKIKYIEAKDFGKVVHDAIVGNSVSVDLEEIKDEYLNYDLLLIDDIQFIQNWKKAKEIFFTIFSSFINNGKQIVVTSDQYIEELKDFEQRFITRFQGGLSLSAVPPDMETSKEIVKVKLKDTHNFDENFISDEAIDFIATNFSSNVRELEGAVNRIIFWTIQFDKNKKIELDDVIEIFKGIKKNSGRGITIKRIISTVAKFYSISSQDIKSKSRKSEIVLARHLSIYFAKDILDLSILEIGKEFKKNHSTIISSIKKIKKEKETNHDLANVIYDLKKKIIN